MRFDFDKLDFIETGIQPEKLAFACSDIDISWSELQTKVNRLAELFAEHNKQRSPVVIYGSKEHFFPVAMLACIKSGIPYIAIDKIIPQERIAQNRDPNCYWIALPT